MFESLTNWNPTVLEAAVALDKKVATALKCVQFFHKHLSNQVGGSICLLALMLALAFFFSFFFLNDNENLC